MTRCHVQKLGPVHGLLSLRSFCHPWKVPGTLVSSALEEKRDSFHFL